MPQTGQASSRTGTIEPHSGHAEVADVDEANRTPQAQDVASSDTNRPRRSARLPPSPSRNTFTHHGRDALVPFAVRRR